MYRQKTIYSFIEAWNVDGSSSDEPLNGYSWISFWEEQTGQQRGRCSYSGCHNDARDGGHIWLKGHGLYIAPICLSCNSSSNPKRMQGGYSSLKTGITVVKITTTEDMELSDRRFSSDYSKDRESYGYYTNKDEYYDSQNSYNSCASDRSYRSSRSSRSSNQSRSEVTPFEWTGVVN